MTTPLLPIPAPTAKNTLRPRFNRLGRRKTLALTAAMFTLASASSCKKEAPAQKDLTIGFIYVGAKGTLATIKRTPKAPKK